MTRDRWSPCQTAAFVLGVCAAAWAALIPLIARAPGVALALAAIAAAGVVFFPTGGRRG